MKEQWKKYDTDAKVFPKNLDDHIYSDIKNNRPIPIQIELPLAAYGQPKDDYCKKLLITLVILVLLALLVLLSWMSIALYSNNHTKMTIVEESAARAHLNGNKQSFKSYSYDDDFKIAKLKAYTAKIKNESKEDTKSLETFVSEKNELSLDWSEDKSNSNNSESSNNEEKLSLAEKNDQYENGSSQLSDNRVTTSKPDISLNENKSEVNINDNNDNHTQEDKSSIVFEDKNSKSYSDNNVLKVNETNVLNTAQLKQPWPDNFQTKKNTQREKDMRLAESGYAVLKISSKILEQFSYNLTYNQWYCKVLKKESPETQEKLLEFIKAAKPRSRRTKKNDPLGSISCPIEEKTGSEKALDDSNSKIIDRDIYVLLARQLEVNVGNYYDLLIWYYQNRKNPDFKPDAEDYLKYLTADILFSTNIRTFSLDFVSLKSNIELDADIYSDYEKVINGTLKNLVPKSISQHNIIDRLMIKSAAVRLYLNHTIRADYIAKTIQGRNWRELDLINVDPYSFISTSKENIEIIKTTELPIVKNTSKVIADEIKVDQKSTSIIRPEIEITHRDIYILMSKQLEALFGNYVDLLAWHCDNRHKSVWMIKKEYNLKALTTELLFNTNVSEFAKDVTMMHTTLLMNIEYLRDYNKIINGTLSGLKPETYTQKHIVDRLVLKSALESMVERRIMSADYIAKSIEDLNRQDLQRGGLDVDRLIPSSDLSRVFSDRLTGIALERVSGGTGKQRQPDKDIIKSSDDVVKDNSNEDSVDDMDKSKKIDNKSKRSQYILMKLVKAKEKGSGTKSNYPEDELTKRLRALMEEDIDDDAKQLVNVEEGRTLPIKIELPLSAFSEDKDDCCKRLFVTFRVFVLLALLVLLSWTAMVVYTNHRVKSTVAIRDESIPTLFDEENKITLKIKVWEDDIKNVVATDVPIGGRVQEKMMKKSVIIKPEYVSTAYGFKDNSVKVDPSPKPESATAEPEQVFINDLLQDWQELVEKMQQEENVSENTVREKNEFTKIQDEKNKAEVISHSSFLNYLVDPMFINQLGQDSQESAEQTQTEKNEEDSESIPIQKWLDILGIEHMLTDGEESIDMQTGVREFTDDSEEATKEDVDKILLQMAEENKGALDQFFKQVVDAISKTQEDLISEQVNAESVKQKIESDEKISENSQASTEYQNLVNSKKLEDGGEKSASEEINGDHSAEEKFLIGFSDSKIFEDSTVVPAAEESTNQSLEEFNKTDEEDAQSTEAPFHGVIQKDIYLLMARRIEGMLGEYDDLLIWYFKNRDEPEPLDDDSQLKYFTARLLFGKDITEFRKYSIFVVSFLMNDDYTRDFSRLVDQSQPKLQTESKTQVQIVNRLVTKSHMRDLYNQGDENTVEIADAIESINLLELRLSGIDVDAFLNSLEGNKDIEEPTREENSSEKNTDDVAKRHQDIIEAMRRIAHFDDIYSQQFSIEDSSESKNDDSQELGDNTSTASFADTTVQEPSEEIDNRRQAFIQDKNNSRLEKENRKESSSETIIKESEAIPSWKEESMIEEVTSESAKEYTEEAAKRRQAFIKALQRITDITEAEKSREEDEETSDQSIKEDETESSAEMIKGSEEIPSWNFVSSLQSISEEEPIAEEVKSDEQSEVDMKEDELTKRLHSLMEDVLNSNEESKESVNMNNFLTVYDGFDY
ncbi:hypothetical protein TSAR_011947 [Trichomalopsis sarcophagae]|uniref:Uncharacterized protein n=1 Tax=Trichomalopsis sarcophagae TaxID=543379 RepID=A0A232F674_9HYME|nr:hypothetical protein TSAR_011947 [Trichomalopsis sarcophagae]